MPHDPQPRMTTWGEWGNEAGFMIGVFPGRIRWRGRRIPGPAGEPVLRAGQNALDVGAVAPNRQGAGDEGKDHQRFIPGSGLPEGWLGLVSVNVAAAIEAVAEDGQAQGGENATQAHKATEEKGGGEDGHAAQQDQRHQGDQDAGRGGNPLASPASEKHRVVMAHDGGEGGDDMETVEVELLVRGELP